MSFSSYLYDCLLTKMSCHSNTIWWETMTMTHTFNIPWGVICMGISWSQKQSRFPMVSQFVGHRFYLPRKSCLFYITDFIVPLPFLSNLQDQSHHLLHKEKATLVACKLTRMGPKGFGGLACEGKSKHECSEASNTEQPFSIQAHSTLWSRVGGGEGG